MKRIPLEPRALWTLVLLLAVIATISAACAPAEDEYDASLRRVDDLLASDLQGKVLFNVPDTMKLDETVDLRMQIRPAQSGDDLTSQVAQQRLSCTSTEQPFSGSSPPRCSDVVVTDQFRATLFGTDLDAFEIVPVDADAAKFANVAAPTEWQWSAKALETGPKSLTLRIERKLVEDGVNLWRRVANFEEAVTVEATALQWLIAGGWMWILPPVVVVLAASLLLRRRKSPILAGRASPLTPGEYAQVRRVLLRCGPFFDESELRALYADPRIYPWREHLSFVGSAAARVDASIDFLSQRADSSGENGLVLLLLVLRDRLAEGDECYAQLDQLAGTLTTVQQPSGS